METGTNVPCISNVNSTVQPKKIEDLPGEVLVLGDLLGKTPKERCLFWLLTNKTGWLTD